MTVCKILSEYFKLIFLNPKDYVHLSVNRLYTDT